MHTTYLKLSGIIALGFLFVVGLSSCTKDSLDDPNMDPMTGGMEEEEEEEEENEMDPEIWTGTNLTFSKSDGGDTNEATNQDRITDEVWITRGNNGGQIFNAKQENNASKSNSPVGTEWALGNIDAIATLDFKPFRSAVGSPKSVVGKDLVLHLIDENIYLTVRFTNWSSSKGGGFSYVRSTP
jgi:hypothetical protein